jgi:ABC-type multidrug transport system ATPase subunit
MIELIGLDKSFGARTILASASLTVRGGESVALVGANGSGKTTTLRCAVGLARVNRGRIRIDGIDPLAHPCDARARLSYLSQRTDFPGTLTVREILSVVKELRNAPADAVDRELELCGLTRLAGRTVAHLSGGERQRVAMAMLFIPDAAAYLLDEPTMSLDPIGTRLLIGRLADLRDRGRAILFTTHLTAELDRLATRVVALRGGRICPVASVSGEGALAAALEALKDEEHGHEVDPGDCGNTRAAGRLWRRASWA